MDPASMSIRKPVLTWLLVLVCLVGGLVGYREIGRLEDPAFTIKQAFVFTAYPGATAEEVETSVTEKVESALQQMPQIKRVISRSMPGRSEVSVEILDSVPGSHLPQVWDELRKRLRDLRPFLPPGAEEPVVNDDFGDVYGMYYALTGDGLNWREFDSLATTLRRELLTIPGVAKVSTQGLQPEEISVEIDAARVAALRISPDEIGAALEPMAVAAPAGGRRAGNFFLQFRAGEPFDSLETVRAVQVGSGERRVALGDVATITRRTVDRPDYVVLHDGVPAITLGVSVVPGRNVVEVGRAVEARLDALRADLPLGTKLHPIYEQHQVVDDAVRGFGINVLVSVAIVVAVLCLFMGWRPGLMIGSILLLTVSGTILILWLGGIELHRISLGALIIAMGMLVDNAIVVGEGVLVRLQRGMKHLEAARETIAQTWWPLLATTFIGLLAFAGIGLAPDSTGEFLFAQFAVAAISLLLSWVLAIALTPLFSTYLLKPSDGDSADPYAGPLFRGYRGLLTAALKARVLALTGLVGLFALSLAGFTLIPASFFPPSTTPIFTVDLLAAQGSDIRATRDLATRAEALVRSQDGVTSVSTFVGAGPERFLLVANPEQPNSAYAQLVVRTRATEDVARLAERLERELPLRFPDVTVAVKQFVFGVPSPARIEVRFLGPDADVLRGLAAKAEVAFRDGGLVAIRQTWGAREPVIRAELDGARSARAGVTRADVGRALTLASEGAPVGVLREEDRLLPISLRLTPPASGRAEENTLIWSSALERWLPIDVVSNGWSTIWTDGIVQRRDRVRSISVMAEPPYGEFASVGRDRVLAAIEAIQLPRGYQLQWGGEFEGSVEANEALNSTLAVPYLLMALLTVLLFGRLRQPLIVWLVVPMSVIGVVAGLLISGLPFAFMSFLGLLSLTGMLIKNAVVLIDEIDRQIGDGVPRFQALLDAAVSRLRPVVLAAGTTILGVVPLLGDAFFQDMAASIIGGLAFATALTLIAVPCLYAVFFRISPEEA